MLLLEKGLDLVEAAGLADPGGRANAVEGVRHAAALAAAAAAAAGAAESDAIGRDIRCLLATPLGAAASAALKMAGAGDASAATNRAAAVASRVNSAAGLLLEHGALPLFLPPLSVTSGVTGDAVRILRGSRWCCCCCCRGGRCRAIVSTTPTCIGRGEETTIRGVGEGRMRRSQPRRRR